MSSALPPPVLIATSDALASFVERLAAADTVAVDTESNSLHAYRERVCLLQFSTTTGDYIVDPIALPDLSSLAPVFADPSKEKILHAAENDLLCLSRSFGFTFANVFDTMTAARALGWTQVGLASILEAQFGVVLDKKHQRADWGHRPLPAEMLDYARLDTHYLPALRQRQYEALVEAGYWEEALDEFDRLARTRAGRNAPDPMAFWRVKGATDLPVSRTAVLQALFQWRESQAERMDRPPFKVMSEASLLALARHAPMRLEDLSRAGGLSPFQVQRHGRNLLRVIQAGLQAPPPSRPVVEREPDDVRDRYDKLHAWRKERARKRGVESDVIVPRTALRDMARRPPRTPSDLANVTDLGPWRRRVYGEELLALLADDAGEKSNAD